MRKEYEKLKASKKLRIRAAKVAAKAKWKQKVNANRIRNASGTHANRIAIAEEGRSLDEDINNKSLNKNNNKIFADTAEEMRLSSLLWGKIRQRKPSFKAPNLQKWAKQIDLMIRIDRRKPEQIEELIHWIQEDPFWQNNVLSTEKLREKFDQLELKMQAQKKKGGGASGGGKKSKYAGIGVTVEADG